MLLKDISIRSKQKTTNDEIVKKEGYKINHIFIFYFLNVLIKIIVFKRNYKITN